MPSESISFFCPLPFNKEEKKVLLGYKLHTKPVLLCSSKESTFKSVSRLTVIHYYSSQNVYLILSQNKV